MDAATRSQQFLESTTVRPATACATCRHPRRIEIDAALRRFVNCRTRKTTAISLSAFVERFLRPEFGYRHAPPAAERHLRGCLGLEIPR